MRARATTAARPPAYAARTRAAAVCDPFREARGEYAASAAPRIVDVASASFLTVTGRGEPGGPAFTTAVGALYGAAWTIRMARARAGQPFKVAPLEGLWWGRTFEGDFTAEPRDAWNWTLLVRVPAFVTRADLRAAQAALAAKGRPDAERLVTLGRLNEGRCVQALHLGPYPEERPTIERMLAFAAGRGMRFRGRHHEIYLSDMRRVPAEKRRTILRVPVSPDRS